MRPPIMRSSSWFLLTACTAAAAALWICSWLRPFSSAAPVPCLTYDLHSPSKNEWKPLGGNWTIGGGTVSNQSYERGAKLLTGAQDWRNYTLTAEMKFTSPNADMGLVLRVRDPAKGTDTYSGYYIGLRTLDESLVIGRSDFGWREARPVAVPGGVQPNTWYRMRVVAYDCNLAASVQNLASGATAWMAFEEPGCISSGRIGLRSLNPGAFWRNIRIAPATWNDYLDIQRHAPSVEHPEDLPSPPWWTPGHVTVLFTGILAVLLLSQLVYFRLRQWKVHTIAQERERLAHDIHDTMAQSFAGIGYQIQGIYHNITHRGSADLSEIAEQLKVSYQLVRRCHEEASRTIAMLGSPLPFTRDLLAALRDIARTLAGDRIHVLAESHGPVKPLPLRLADALLHIGREAIVNAVNHSEMNLLFLTLVYSRNTVELVIEDDGRGFEVRPESTGFGLRGMQKRARDVGAVLHIHSTPGKGTRVHVIARLQPERPLKRFFRKLRGKLPPVSVPAAG
ncbi:MAG: DUF1080 domain-containing protein [Bacillota bacterium]|nr:DUF1080 domain-containing protein [Bacillota bacterium]